ncbi:small ribosomal subunit protein bS18m isoform X2 [Carettochelys insculpta]|uniref:small ribosomal subunit protein bS18m isoform X2 n=1 Tax=Carettochelys insculpta TaxID=44489 RepID=UPI003EB7E596
MRTLLRRRRQQLPDGCREGSVGRVMAVTRGWGRLQQILAAGEGSSAVLWRRGYSSQQEQVSCNVDLPVEMENPYKEPPKRCVLCGINVDYKNVQLLSQFISPYTGRIYGRHITGLCAKKQKEISKAIKRAHVIGFMPVAYKDPIFLNDPKICDIRHPD